MENILNSVKLALGIMPEYEAFNYQILMHINSVFSTLKQLGVGPEKGFTADMNSIWADFISDDDRIESVKSYMYLKVKLLFDPPSYSFVLESMQREISEFEWRLNVEADTYSNEEI